MNRGRIPTIIGLTGFAGCGKGSVAEILSKTLNYQIKSMGTEMRAEALRKNPTFQWEGKDWTYAELINSIGYDRTKREVPGVRKFLIGIGHGYRLTKGEDIWLNYVLPPPEDIQPDWLRDAHIVIDDVRYKNEADRIHRLGGVVWRIHRPGFYAAAAEEAESVAQIPVDAEIQNSGNLSNLASKVFVLL